LRKSSGGAAGEKQKLDEVQRKIELYERAFRMQANVGAVFSLIGDVQHVASSPDEKQLAVSSGNQIPLGEIIQTTIQCCHHSALNHDSFANLGRFLRSTRRSYHLFAGDFRTCADRDRR
jgi:hypothetical protein